MKLKQAVAAMFLMTSLALMTCGGVYAVEAEEQNEIGETADEPFVVDKEIYSDDHVDLTCKEIDSDGILFECTNKTPRDVELMLDIALDGKLQSMWCDASESTLPAGETKEFFYNANNIIKSTEHKTISIAGIGFVDNTEYLSFDVANYDIGGSSNPDELASGEAVYSSGVMDIEFIGLTAQGIEFKASNKTNGALDFFVDDIVMNDNVDGYGSAFTLPAHTEGICDHDVINYVDNFNGDDIKKFTANFSVNLPDQGTVQLCSMTYDNGNVSSTVITDLGNAEAANSTETQEASSEESEQDDSLTEAEETESSSEDLASDLSENFLGYGKYVGEDVSVFNADEGYWDADVPEFYHIGRSSLYGNAGEVEADVGWDNKTVTMVMLIFDEAVHGDDYKSISSKLEEQFGPITDSSGEETKEYSYSGDCVVTLLPSGAKIGWNTDKALEFMDQKSGGQTESSFDRSATQVAFDAATHLTKADLTDEGQWFSGGEKYSFKGNLLDPEDCAWVDDDLNTTGSVEAGAIYREVGNLLEGFDEGLNNGENYCEMVFGVPFGSKDALIPYVESAEDLYKEKYPMVSIMKKFESLDSVSGDFDFDYNYTGKYSIVIENTTDCANEMMISEEMLGYVIAELTEYAPDISFDGNKCTIDYEAYFPKQ